MEGATITYACLSCHACEVKVAEGKLPLDFMLTCPVCQAMTWWVIRGRTVHIHTTGELLHGPIADR